MLNAVSIMGRLTKEPDVRYTQSGKPVANFGLACERDFVGQNGKREVDFFDVTAWNTTAEFIQKYFHTGDMIVISGRLTTRKWTDSNGATRKEVEITAERVYFGGRNNSRNAHVGEQQPDTGTTFEELSDDDGELPF